MARIYIPASLGQRAIVWWPGLTLGEEGFAESYDIVAWAIMSEEGLQDGAEPIFADYVSSGHSYAIVQSDGSLLMPEEGRFDNREEFEEAMRRRDTQRLTEKAAPHA